MHTVYLACLVGGAVATALFALLGVAGGGAHGHLGAGHGHAGVGHAHGGSGAHGSGAHGQHAGAQHGAHVAGAGKFAASVGWSLSWLSPLAIAAAALWFGGVGLLTGGGVLGFILAIIAAVIGALIVRTLFNAFVSSSTPPLELTAEGAVATVNATIRPDAPGEVLYTLEGLHRSLPARSSDGLTIPRGTAVVITRREGGFAWVEPLDPLPATQDERSMR
jgi:membrane protein implicated in regulation of membrane protease activity